MLIPPQAHGALAGLVAVGHGFVGQAGPLEVAGQVGRDLGQGVRVARVQRLRAAADLRVEVRPLDVIQGVVEVDLEQDVAEAVGRQALAIQSLDAAGGDQAVLPVQVGAQAAEQGRLVGALYAEDAVREDTLFGDLQEGREAVRAFAESFLAWVPDAQWNLVEAFGEGRSMPGEDAPPVTGGIFAIGVTDANEQPCEVLAAVLLQAPGEEITHEELCYDPGSLIVCGWAR